MKLELRTEIKLLALITLILSIGFSIINFISISSFRSQLYHRIKSESELYQILLFYNQKTPLPEYFKLSKQIPVDYQTWQILGKEGEYFLLLNTKKIEEEINRYAVSLFVWETPILILTVLIVYKTVNVFLRREKEIKEMVKLFFMLFAHKLGNFLSLNKLNLEILLQKYGSDKSLLRLKRSYDVLEEDFKRSLDYIRTLEDSQGEEVVDLAEIIEKLVMKYHSVFPTKRIELSLLPTRVKVKRGEAESFFQLLIENAFKYASTFVSVDIEKERGSYKITLMNDVGEVPSGTGIGLKLVNFLADKLGWQVKVYPGKKRFTVEVRLN